MQFTESDRNVINLTGVSAAAQQGCKRVRITEPPARFLFFDVSSDAPVPIAESSRLSLITTVPHSSPPETSVTVSTAMHCSYGKCPK